VPWLNVDGDAHGYVIDDETHAIVARYNALDLKLYERVRRGMVEPPSPLGLLGGAPHLMRGRRRQRSVPEVTPFGDSCDCKQNLPNPRRLSNWRGTRTKCHVLDRPNIPV
jgi:hypothetical protein